MKRLSLLAIVFLLSALCFPQTAFTPYVQGGIGYLGHLGYENPDFTATTGARYQAPHWAIEGSGQFDSAHKYIGNGYSWAAQGGVFGCWGGGDSCAGVGAQWGEEVTSEWKKESWRPLIFLRHRCGRLMLTAHFNPTAGSDFQNFEHAGGITGEYTVSKHLTLVGDSTAAAFKPTNQPNASWMVGGEVSGGVRYGF